MENGFENNDASLSSDYGNEASILFSLNWKVLMRKLNSAGVISALGILL